MATRDAVSTIRGYFYQFDYSILQVLRLENDTDTICVEGIEDLDINDENNIILHQCKCYEGTEYNHSEIKDALEWMLKHFSDNKDSEYKYYLYGVYKSGQDKLPQVIDVDFAKKNFFTKKHRDAPTDYLYQKLSLSDDDIALFLQKLEININAVGLEAQEKAARDELCKGIGCKPQEIEPYYCNALSIIRRLATQNNCSDRTISRSQFIQEVKEVDNQFDMWLLHKNGVDKFAKAIKKKYFSDYNISPYSRFFIIEVDNKISIAEIKTAILHIARKYSKLRKHDTPKFSPFFCFCGINDANLIELKKQLSRDNVVFTDGYNFRGAEFDAHSIVKKPTNEHPIMLRIIDDVGFLESVYELCESPIEIYQFYRTTSLYENSDHTHIKIPFEKINDIVQMI